MIDALKKVTTSTIEEASSGINGLLTELREEMGQSRFSDELYMQLMRVSILVNDEYYKREKAKEGL